LLARLPDFRLSVRELMGLAAGSVLSTGLPRTEELDITIGGQRRFRGAPGRIGPSLAVRITDGLAPAPETDALPISRVQSK
jgi:flagellar motor switch protein FliM